MRVEELEIIGFKSFVDKVKLSFNPGITALVGPNGCGKSNIMDAFRWIMGEQNARNLRGKIMEDLIFNGSESRKSLGMAEVSMVLTSENGHYTSEPVNEITQNTVRTNLNQENINSTTAIQSVRPEQSGRLEEAGRSEESGKLATTSTTTPTVTNATPDATTIVTPADQEAVTPISQSINDQNTTATVNPILNSSLTYIEGAGLVLDKTRIHYSGKDSDLVSTVVSKEFALRNGNLSNDYYFEVTRLDDSTLKISLFEFGRIKKVVIMKLVDGKYQTVTEFDY